MQSTTSTTPRSPLPSSSISQNQSHHQSVGIILGASIAGVIGVVSLIAAILLYVRTRSRRKTESPRPPPNMALNKDRSHPSHPETTGSNSAVESGGREVINELPDHPNAIRNPLPVGELEGRR